jgi:hypothetical protein
MKTTWLSAANADFSSTPSMNEEKIAALDVKVKNRGEPPILSSRCLDRSLTPNFLYRPTAVARLKPPATAWRNSRVATLVNFCNAFLRVNRLSSTALLLACTQVP